MTLDERDEPPIHPTARGFEQAASAYDRARPDYADAAVEAVTARLHARPGTRLLDVGAGTGKLTVPLLRAGAEVVAVEPTAAMRAELQRVVPDELRDRLTVLEGTAESLPLDDASVDGATAAQAFHWFDPVPALTELHRVLVPDAWLAVVHNRRDLSSPPQAALDDLLRPHRGDTPSWIDERWSEVLADPPGFSPAATLTYPQAQTLDADGFVGRVASVSFVARLPEPSHRQILDAARLLFTMLERDGTVTLAYVTEVRLLQRLAT